MAFGHETSQQYHKNMIMQQITSHISETTGQNVHPKNTIFVTPFLHSNHQIYFMLII